MWSGECLFQVDIGVRRVSINHQAEGCGRARLREAGGGAGELWQETLHAKRCRIGMRVNQRAATRRLA